MSAGTGGTGVPAGALPGGVLEDSGTLGAGTGMLSGFPGMRTAHGGWRLGRQGWMAWQP